MFCVKILCGFDTKFKLKSVYFCYMNVILLPNSETVSRRLLKWVDEQFSGGRTSEIQSFIHPTRSERSSYQCSFQRRTNSRLVNCNETRQYPISILIGSPAWQYSVSSRIVVYLILQRNIDTPKFSGFNSNLLLVVFQCYCLVRIVDENLTFSGSPLICPIREKPSQPTAPFPATAAPSTEQDIRLVGDLTTGQVISDYHFKLSAVASYQLLIICSELLENKNFFRFLICYVLIMVKLCESFQFRSDRQKDLALIPLAERVTVTWLWPVWFLFAL